MIRTRRFVNAVGRHWLRLALGAIVGLLVVTVVLVDLLVVLESQHAAYDFADTYASAALTLLMFGCVGGALYAYARRQPQGGHHAASRVPARDRGPVRGVSSECGTSARSQDVPRGAEREPVAVGRTTGDVGLDAAMDVVARARLHDANSAA